MGGKPKIVCARACVRAFVCVCVYCIQVLFRLSQTTFFFFLHKIRFFRQQFIFKYTNGKIQLNKNNDKKSCNLHLFSFDIRNSYVVEFFPIRTSLCPSDRFLNVKKLWTTKIGNKDDLIECLSYNRFLGGEVQLCLFQCDVINISNHKLLITDLSNSSTLVLKFD